MYDIVSGEKPPRLPDARQTTPNMLYASRGETLSHPTTTLEMQPYSADTAAEVDVDYVSSKCLRVLCLSILVVVSLFLAIVAVVLVMLLWFGVYTPDYTCPTVSSPTTQPQPQTGSTQPSESPITCTCPGESLYTCFCMLVLYTCFVTCMYLPVFLSLHILRIMCNSHIILIVC